MSKIKNGGLDQYDAEPFQQQQFGTAGVEGVKRGSLTVVGNYSAVDVGSLPERD